MNIDRFIRRKELLAIIPIGKSTLYAMIQAGEFPKPVTIGRRAVGWREREISEWLNARS